MFELPERLEVLVDEDVEHEEREGRGEGEEGEGQELVVDDKVCRSEKVPVPQERYVVLQSRSIGVSDDTNDEAHPEVNSSSFIGMFFVDSV